MKHLFRIVPMILFSIYMLSCRAQMVQIPADAKKLELNKQQFIGKPLKNILKEIKPEIKMATISRQQEADLTHFRFSFVERRRYVVLQDQNTPAVTIRVSVSGIAITDPEYKERRMSGFPWTEQDVQKFGNYTIKSIGVFGDVKNR